MVSGLSVIFGYNNYPQLKEDAVTIAVLGFGMGLWLIATAQIGRAQISTAEDTREMLDLMLRESERQRGKERAEPPMNRLTAHR